MGRVKEKKAKRNWESAGKEERIFAGFCIDPPSFQANLTVFKKMKEVLLSLAEFTISIIASNLFCLWDKSQQYPSNVNHFELPSWLPFTRSHVLNWVNWLEGWCY